MAQSLSLYLSTNVRPNIGIRGEERWLGQSTLTLKPNRVNLSSHCCRLKATASQVSNIGAVDIPRQWYNLISDLPIKPPPPLHPKTFEPVKPEDLSPLFPDELIKQEATTDRFIDIPEEVLDVYRLWRPTPLIRAKRLEPLIGLKLGKRTYFENNCASNNATASSPAAISASSTVTTKKLKASCLNGPVPRCQVEGCNLDLSSTKEYYWKHRVCENHSKSPKVVIGGVERRFCQQCSRFHGLLEFDEKKRSCRKRLSDHNARRRKPQQETIPFNSTRLSSSIYDVQQQLNFVLNDFPVVQSRPPATNSVWESCASDSKFTLTRDYHVKPEENIIVDRQPHLPAIQLPRHYSNRVLPSKTASAEVLNQDMKEPVFPGGAAPDYCRALSLLSTTTNCWGSCEELESPTLHHHHPHHPMHENGNTTTLPFHAVSQGLLLPPASPEYWQHTNQHSTIPPQSHQLHHHAAAAANPNTITGFKEFQIFKDSHFYSKN